MTNEEFDQMRALIKRYAEAEMDQWSMWRTTTALGPIYISISRVQSQVLPTTPTIRSSSDALASFLNTRPPDRFGGPRTATAQRLKVQPGDSIPYQREVAAVRERQT